MNRTTDRPQWPTHKIDRKCRAIMNNLLVSRTENVRENCNFFFSVVSFLFQQKSLKFILINDSSLKANPHTQLNYGLNEAGKRVRDLAGWLAGWENHTLMKGIKTDFNFIIITNIFLIRLSYGSSQSLYRSPSFLLDSWLLSWQSHMNISRFLQFLEGIL